MPPLHIYWLCISTVKPRMLQDTCVYTAVQMVRKAKGSFSFIICTLKTLGCLFLSSIYIYIFDVCNKKWTREREIKGNVEGNGARSIYTIHTSTCSSFSRTGTLEGALFLSLKVSSFSLLSSPDFFPSGFSPEYTEPMKRGEVYYIYIYIYIHLSYYTDEGGWVVHLVGYVCIA